MKLDISVRITAPPRVVWQHLADIAGHTAWMADAVSIRFLTDQRHGVGVRFTCRTRVGFLTTTDLMEVTEWEPERVMGVRHTGAVSGEGRFELHPDVTPQTGGGGATVLGWREELRFPWWLGAGVGSFLARPLLGRIWRRNLQRFKQQVESAGPH